MKLFRIKAVGAVAFIATVAAFSMQIFLGIYFERNLFGVLSILGPFIGFTLAAVLIACILIYYALKPIDHAYKLVKKGEIPDSMLVQKSRKAGNKVLLIIVSVVSLGFLLGPIITILVNSLLGLKHYTTLDTALLVIFNCALGGMTALQCILAVENIIRQPLELIGFTTAQKNVELASLSGRLLLSTIFSVLFTAFAMLLALKGYSDKGTEVSLMQRILEMIPLILILTGWSIYLVGTIVNSTISRIRAITKRITEITDENGDLTQRISLIRDDDIGLLAFAFNTFVETIETLIGSAKQLTSSVADSAEKLNSSSDTAQESMNTMKQSLSVISEAFQHQNLIVTDTKSRIDDLVSSIQEVADQVSSQSAVVDESSASITEMAANIANVSKTSEKADEVAEELKKQADEGGDALKASIEAIKDLESTSQNVRVIVGTISKIASQTNLLAMNAAIEAAHAGEAGSGFAVVADEVRTLAESAAKSAKDIISLIKNMIDRISQAVTLADKAGNAFQGILAGVESTSELVRTIAASMEEQRLGTEEILKSTRALIDATHTIKEVTGEQRIESADMLAAMEELTKASNNIIVSVQEEMKSIKKVNEAIMLVKEESHANKERVKSLANSLMQFKIRASEN